MIQYYLGNLSKGKSGLQLNKGLQISQQEYVQLFDCFKFTGFYSVCRSVKNMTIESAADLEEFLCDLEQKNASICDIKMDKLLITGNKVFINFLSFIRTFIDVIKHTISQWNAAELDSFSKLNSELYDEFFGYRFFTRMRNYVVHYNMPLTTMEDTISSGVAMYCVREQLLQYDGWSTVRKEIEQLPERIDITPYIAEAKVAISTLYLKSLETIVMSAVKAGEKIAEVCEKNKITSPVILVTRDDEIVSMEEVPLQSLRDFFVDLKDHPNYEIDIGQNKIKVTHHV